MIANEKNQQVAIIFHIKKWGNKKKLIQIQNKNCFLEKKVKNFKFKNLIKSYIMLSSEQC